MHPRAQRRIFAVEHVPAGVKLRLGAVVVVSGVHGADEGNIVHALAEVRPPIADLDPALAALAEANLQRVERVALLAVGIVDDDDARQFEFFGILSVLEGRLGDGLAGELGEHRLGIEALHMTDAAVHEQPDDVLRLRREVGVAVGRRPRGAG